MFAKLERISTRARLAGLAMLSLAVLAAPARAQEKPSGAEVWGANCGRCHRMRALDAYDARQWETVVTHMALTARLTPDETEAVRDFLVGAARARAPGGAAAARAVRPVLLASAVPGFVPASASLSDHSGCCNVTVGAAIYKSACVVCHGKEGKGDGPVAVALKPRPANLTDTTRIAKLSDDSLFQIITKGSRAMPSFAADLNAEQVREVVNYIRTLKP